MAVCGAHEQAGWAHENGAGSRFTTRVRAAFVAVGPGSEQRAAPRAGDQLVPRTEVVVDRAFTPDVAANLVWPWLVQLGKQRAGRYLPRAVEPAVPPSCRALRRVEARWLDLRAGDVVPDYGGREETFRIAELSAEDRLVYRSRRGRTELSWSITVRSVPAAADTERTRVSLRLRMAPRRHKRLAETVGGLLDLLTVAGLAAGLRERLAEQGTSG
jgi:hypothetical protein